MNPSLQAALEQVQKAKQSAAHAEDRAQTQGAGGSAVDWPAAVRQATPERLLALAAERGVSVATLEWLRAHSLIGWHEGRVAFPLHNQKGEVTGCHVKTPPHWVWHKPQDQPIAPLVLGNLLEASHVIGCESQWDAIAVADKLGGFQRGAAFICTRGAGNGGMLGKVPIPKEARLVLLPQNDAPNTSGRIASEEWFSAARKSLTNTIVYRARVPAAYADANDWIRAGATAAQVTDAITLAQNATVAELRVRSIVDCAEKPIDESCTLLGNRYLCREGSMLFIGPSGVGKSSASVQQDICWGLGMEAFGIKPARPLNILTIQAENDDGDMTEMSRGVIDGLGLHRDQREVLRRQVIYATVKTKTGNDFIREVLAPLLDNYRPDIVRIDPFQSYLGDDFKEARALLDFCQGGLNPLLEQYQCACILNHHTPKTSNRDTANWKATDWMYAGAGSAHLTNWARAVLVVDATKVAGLFKFIAAKRGGRLGWEDGVERYFAHSRKPGSIVWEEPDVVDILEAEHTPDRPNRKNGTNPPVAPKAPVDNLGALLRQIKDTPMSSTAWERAAKEQLHISRASFYRLHKELQQRHLIALEGRLWTATGAAESLLPP